MNALAEHAPALQHFVANLPTTKHNKVQISERALAQRISRRLAPECIELRSARPGSRLEANVGRYYLLHASRNEVIDIRVVLTDLGRELGVFAEWEELEQN